MTTCTKRSRGYKKNVLLFDEFEVTGFNAGKEFSHFIELVLKFTHRGPLMDNI